MAVRESSPGRGKTTYNTPSVFTRLDTLETEVGGIVVPDVTGKADKTYVDSQDGVLSAQLAEIMTHENPYLFISDYPIQVPETDDSGRLQRAINEGQNKAKTLIINQALTIGQQINITGTIQIDGVNWSIGKITLTSANANITISKSTTNADFVYNVELRNLWITGNHVANYVVTLNTVSQIIFKNVYVEKAVTTNLSIINGSIMYFNGLYSYYGNNAIHIEGSNNINFTQNNLWSNTNVFDIKGTVTDVTLHQCWYEAFNRFVNADSSVVTTLYMYSLQCHFLSSNNPGMMMVQNTNATIDKSLVMIFEQARFNLPDMTGANLFEIATMANNSLIKFDISNSYLYLPASVTAIVKTDAVNARNHMHVSYFKNRSKDVNIVTNNTTAIILSPVTKYDGEQVFYSAFVLPQNVSASNAAALEGSMYYDPSTHMPYVKDSASGGYTGIALAKRGTTANRPTTGLFSGLQYYDQTLNKPIWYNGSAWTDATGATV